MLIFTLIIIHIIGAVIAMIIDYKNGIFEWASEQGDGIRNPKPSDIVFLNCVAWEIELLLFIMELVGKTINSFFNNRCGSKQ